MARGTNKRDEGEAAVNVMRISAAGKERHYIAYATGLLLEKGTVLHARQIHVPLARLKGVDEMPKTEVQRPKTKHDT